MSYFNKLRFNFVIFGFIWQLIIIARVNSLKITVDKQEIELQIADYSNHLNILKETNKGVKRLWKASPLKKQVTEICNLTPAQLLTLCQWIASSEPYRSSKFVIVPLDKFLPVCFTKYFRLSSENDRRGLNMVTCPYIKKKNLNSELDKQRLAVLPGVLFVSGSLGSNSVLVFISRLRNDEIIYEPYGHVTEIDMAALKKIKNFNEAAKKAQETSVEIDNLSTTSEDSEKFVNVDSSERLLRFKDLL